jgi:cysteinyl-tRNA synthetase
MFLGGEWSAWDEGGIPIKDAKGEEVTKSRRKKMVKEFEAQGKLHDEYLKSLEDLKI